MANQNQKSITETSINIDPVAVVFNVENDVIENFVQSYLTHTRKIEGVAAIRLHVVRDGNRNPEVALYAFFDQNSKDVYTSVRNVPKHLRHKMDMGGYKASDNLYNALKPIAKDFKLGADPRNGLVYIKLNIFRVLGLMLAADSRVHQLQITEVAKLKKKKAVVSVIKQNKFIDRSDAGGFDKFSNIIDRIEN